LQGISEALGFPLSRTEPALLSLESGVEELLRDGFDRELNPIEQAVFEHALQRSEQFGYAPLRESKPAADAGAIPPAPRSWGRQTIEHCARSLQGAHDLLMTLAQDAGEEVEMERALARRLKELLDELIVRAEVVLLTDDDSSVTYCNGAALLLAANIDGILDVDPAQSGRRWQGFLRFIRSRRALHPHTALSLGPFGGWILHIVEIIEESSPLRAHRYIYIIRNLSKPPVKREMLDAFARTLALLEQQIALWALTFESEAPEVRARSREPADDPLVERRAHTRNMSALTDRLASIVIKADAGIIRAPGGGEKGRAMSEEKGKDPELRDAAAAPADDPELKKPGGGLYEAEFWAISRHEAIAGAAEALLSTAAASEVQRILEPLGHVMADVAGWADTIKRRRPMADDDPDTVAFLEDERNKAQPTWHYVNLPLDAEGYDRERYATFTRDDDLVQILAEAIRVLQGRSDRWSEVNALRLVVHLVGDIHQPIHVGCCFIDESSDPPKLVRDPAEAEGLDSDRGGNHIILPLGESGADLHSYWDKRLGGKGAERELGAGSDVEGDALTDAAPEPSAELKKRFIAKLSAMIQRDDVTAGEADAADAPLSPPDEWPVQWATDALVLAREAYESLTITGRHPKGYEVTWEGREAYDSRCKPIVISQLKLAARNLAKLLGAIFRRPSRT
jgi:hypothetical protein